ncbi:MAG: helix-turn-helix transcriptional regulator [Oscillospiraceae bacterium]|nr:helix-turn-helix transcriptional regulator [Oscillospiraceae bacterium]
MEKTKDVTFALRLRALYAAAAYDRKELARIAGVSIPTVMQWEEGEKTPDLTQFKRVAAYFSLPCEFFLKADLPEFSDGLPMNWKIADALGLSEGTVERLKQLAESAPGEALDGLDDAIFSMTDALLASREEWDRP